MPGIHGAILGTECSGLQDAQSSSLHDEQGVKPAPATDFDEQLEQKEVPQSV